MIGRAGSRAECPDLLIQEREHGLPVQTSGRLLIQKALVRRAAALGQEEEFVCIAVFRINLDLSRKIALGVRLFVHRDR